MSHDESGAAVPPVSGGGGDGVAVAPLVGQPGAAPHHQGGRRAGQGVQEQGQEQEQEQDA